MWTGSGWPCARTVAFIQSIYEILEPDDVFQGLYKAMIFALITVMVGTSNGFSVSGGAVLRTDRVVIAGNETLGNSSNNGGGLVLNGGDVTLDRTTIKDNRADNVGGGIAVYTGDLRIKRSSITRCFSRGSLAAK